MSKIQMSTNKPKRTFQEEVAIEAEMHQRLTEIPLAHNNPFAYIHALEETLSALQKTISSLKNLLAKLIKYTYSERVQWFIDAYANFTPTQSTLKTVSSNPSSSVASIPTIHSESEAMSSSPNPPLHPNSNGWKVP